MQGFMSWRIKLFLRRAITVTPSLIILAIGVSTTSVLVISQVALSFGIPFALVPLILISRKKSVMGSLVNRPITTIAASGIAGIIIALNVFLIFDTIFG